jgi:hypothetical protein
LELRPADPPLVGRPLLAPPVKGGWGGKWKRRGFSKPIATASPPAAPTTKPGASLIEIVQQANDVLRRSSATVKRCYPDSTLPPSKVSVDLTIQSDGRISDANIDGAEDGADCVLRTLRGLRFPAPSDGDSYSTRFDFVNLRRQ